MACKRVHVRSGYRRVCRDGRGRITSSSPTFASKSSRKPRGRKGSMARTSCRRLKRAKKAGSYKYICKDSKGDIFYAKRNWYAKKRR